MKLKELRKEKGLTQQDIANLLKIPKSTYGFYEVGKTEPNIETLKKLANFYDVSLDFLCDRPRPYDLPSSATKEQKDAITMILQLNEANTLRIISYCAGLLAGQS